MQEKAEVDQTVPDAELVASVSNAQERQGDTVGQMNPNLLLHDFARELPKKRLWMMDDEAKSALIMKQEPSIFVRGRTTPGLLATLTTHHHRRCPYCHGAVYREKRKGLSKLTFVLSVRPYRCVDCDRLHYGFCF
jgi:hypothetical protein